ncbi:adenylosuccinate synthase [Candidatus Curtissbacteria bacterium]|jgi:adenylosuccinate synthase|nr:adenylosuccinate synthase [Candidatus Curtissbacteria bacterium]
MKVRQPEVIAVIGGQWGDEGKGKVVDFLASQADVVIRGQGGDNAGHTVHNPRGKFALHLVPAGIFNPDTLNIIGAGVALNPKSLLSEIDTLASQNVTVENLLISPKAHLALDYHLYIDRYQEDARGDGKIGTTKRGIGPTYVDKADRVGLPAKFLLDTDSAMQQLEKVLTKKRKYYGFNDVDEFQADYYLELFKEVKQRLGAQIRPTEEIVTEHLAKGSNFVLEGSQGVLLDNDHGTYPMVTSSNTSVGGLVTGAGVPPTALTKTIGIFKAYQSRVGAGGMPTELLDKKGDELRNAGHEFGTTTGRPRRVGYFDGVAARYAQMFNGFTDIALTRIDTLANLGELKVAHDYKIDGEKVSLFPVDDPVLQKATAEYDDFEGWSDFDQTNYQDLPEAVKVYCEGVMKNIPGAKLSFIGTGQDRKDLIVL